MLFGRPQPSETDARRAISAFYYSVFHLLSQEGARILTTKAGSALQAQVARAFSHTVMRKVCEAYSRRKSFPTPLDALVSVPPSPDLLAVCDQFVLLQQARHLADYDLSTPVTLTDAIDHWASCRLAHDAFARVGDSPEMVVFLSALLLNDKWTRRG